MDFGTLLSVAKKNSESLKSNGKYYCTKYAPPKKECKDKKLSENIQRFIQKRELEERERNRLKRAKVNALLAKRDEKAKNKIRKMLKVTKSANKSVLDDTKEKGNNPVENSSDDIGGQDDYGYVSTVANTFYENYLEKVKDVKEDKRFAPVRPQSINDLSSTKERVKAALHREKDDIKNGLRQRTTNSGTPTTTSVIGTSNSKNRESHITVARAYTTSKSLYDPEAEKREEERKKREEERKKAKTRKPLPPPMDFQSLLKLAAKKQHEPVEALLLENKKKSEPERLLSAKEKREMEERQRLKDERAKRDRERAREDRDKSQDKGKKGEIKKINGLTSNHNNSNQRMEPHGRIPKLNQSSSGSTTSNAAKRLSPPKGNNTSSKESQHLNNKSKSVSAPSSNRLPSSSAPTSLTKSNDKFTTNASTSGTSKNTLKPSSANIKKTISNSTTPSSSNQIKNPYGSAKNGYNGPTRDFPPRDNNKVGSSTSKPTRPFPPANERGGVNRKAAAPPSSSQKALKRRIVDDDEDEYDSELDDFIDDDEAEEDISSHIRSIFGYDKRKYHDLDDDDADMESSYAQMQREEFISKKIGMQEDLEDMRQEELHKKRKMQKKRRLNDDDD